MVEFLATSVRPKKEIHTSTHRAMWVPTFIVDLAVFLEAIVVDQHRNLANKNDPKKCNEDIYSILKNL